MPLFHSKMAKVFHSSLILIILNITSNYLCRNKIIYVEIKKTNKVFDIVVQFTKSTLRRNTLSKDPGLT